MKVLFKTLQGKQFEVETVPEDTVAELKRKVAVIQGFEQDALSCRLIFSGKVLNDENAKLQDLNIKENSFLVVMPPKKTYPRGESTLKVADANQGKETGAQASASQEKPQSAQSSVNEGFSGSVTTGKSATESSQTSEVTSDFVIGSQYEATVKNLMEMGFEEQQVKRALRAAFHNPDRAVEYLFQGIPESIEQELGDPRSAQGASVSQQTSSETVPRETSTDTRSESQPFNMFQPQRTTETLSQPTESTGHSGSLDFLTRIPQFHMMRRLIQANPRILQPMLQELAQANPSLLDLIHQNQQEFIRLLNEPTEDSEGLNEEQVQELVNSLSGSGGEGGVGEESSGMVNVPIMIGVSYIQVTPEEREQIERLESLISPMGVSRAAILEAWLACDRNEELAANYILSNLEEYTQEGQEGENEETDRNSSS
eukprot:jgi/Galph1/4408/GphlegSOOS_G3048.1